MGKLCILRRFPFIAQKRTGSPYQPCLDDYDMWLMGRIEAVQQYVAGLNGLGGPGDVQETLVRDDGYPAGMVDAVFTGFKANQPVPMLPPSGALESSN